MGCGHRTLYRKPAPRPGDWLWCTRCDRGVQVTSVDEEQTMDHGPCSVTRLPRGRWRRTEQARQRATDWSAGPQAVVVLACGHVRHYRPPSPARGDWITCGCCGRPTIVLLPRRRADRHAMPLTEADVYGPSR